MSVEVPGNNTPADKLALFLSGALSPFLIGPIFTALFCWEASQSPQEFLKWFGLCFFFSSGVPAGYISWAVYRGHITDLHVRLREQRERPFIAGVLGMGSLAAALLLLEAPAMLTHLVSVFFVNSILFALVSRHWKISMHTGTLAACLAASIEILGWHPLWLLLEVPLVWARAQRGRHLWSQGAAGAIIGYTLTAYPIRWLIG